MRLSITALAAGLLLAPHAVAFGRSNAMDIGPDDDTVSAADLHKRAETVNGWGTFDQLIDHANPSLGTFKQRYWYGTEFWKGPGSPVYLVTPGEQSGEGFNRTWLGSARLSGLMANQTGGAVVILEHRYWGGSSPYAELTVDNLQHLTLDNSLKDLTHFAKTFVPPFDTSGGSSADKAPWVFAGGSYAGALAGWLAALEPGTFWAYYSSSGVVEAVGDFWQYFAPVQEATPKNCSADVDAVINYVDWVLSFGSEKRKKALKDKFMLGDLVDEDFAAALEWGPWQWQSTQFYSVKNLGYTPYYRFCDYVENVWPNSTNKVPGARGVGLTKALDGYAKYMKEEILPGYCEAAGYPDWKGKFNVGCFQNLNASNVAYKDLTPDNYINRQWNWMLCNEPFEWWQDGAPLTERTLVSRLVNPTYWRKQCPLFFPEGGYGLATGKRARDVNRWTGGWSATNTTRAMHTNGQLDPWRDATLSSAFRPGGPVKSSKQLPVRLVKGGVHCSDMYGPNWDANEEVRALALDAAGEMRGWVGEWYEERGVGKPWEV
ncbi:serine carboxypeptidase S28-domain-containing protein [Parachaetomium inaequale]|uniref:Serine carboxypeptidase S28-domain-containing protein n=1 Tax=Parachaetomium inaequale TaxID=2588326 RepID=A0AAN6P7X5_9PEZI|nr:serine carboxypeptidase S28-domain-containing protein [Parachaetomium inaequale]